MQLSVIHKGLTACLWTVVFGLSTGGCSTMSVTKAIYVVEREAAAPRGYKEAVLAQRITPRHSAL